jgi:Vitamin K-dependent gamma-carboxylase
MERVRLLHAGLPVRRTVAAWERFWFAEEPTSTLALLRVAFAVLALAWALTLLPDVDALFGRTGVVAGSRAAPAVLGVLLVAAASLLVGYRSRLAAGTVLACLVWFNHVDPAVMNAGDQLLRDIGLVLALAPAGAALSVDAARRGRDGGFWRCPRRAAWPLRLVQVQISLMYLASVAWKLQGATWRDGTAVSYPLRVPGIARAPGVDALVTSLPLAHVLTWGTLTLELCIGVLVWNRRLRPWVLAAGLAFHLSIEATLAPGFFSWAVLVGYVAFVPPERASRLIAAVEVRVPHRERAAALIDDRQSRTTT